MKTLVISPYSQNLRNGKQNAKNFPHWQSVIRHFRAQKVETIQIGRSGEIPLGTDQMLYDLSFPNLKFLIEKCDCWASVDNFMGHFGAWLKKPGVVLFGKSDPKIFGHSVNTNLLKDRKYLRSNQFWPWEDEPYDPSVFVDEGEAQAAILTLLKRP